MNCRESTRGGEDVIEIKEMHKASDQESEELMKKQKEASERHMTMTPQERRRAAVYATGNKWAIENFEATH